jgi:Protein of unknown function (DUF2726)
MSWEFVLGIVVIVLIGVAAAAVRKRTPGIASDFYVLRPTLFTAAERSFLGVLDQAVGTDFRVFGQVRLSDVADLKRGLPPRVRQSALNRIQAKHLDFVLCDPHTLEIKCAIELDDSSHAAQASRRDRDAFLTSVCTSIGLPLVRIAAKHSYSVAELRALLLPNTQSQAPANSATPALHPRAQMCGGEVRRAPG